MKKRKNRSRKRLGLLIILFLLISPFLSRRVKSYEPELVTVPELENITRVNNIDVEEFIKDKPNCTIIFYNPSDEKINNKLMDFIQKDKKILKKLKSEIYLDVMTQKDRDRDYRYEIQEGFIKIAYFENQKMVNVFTITENTKLSRDFVTKMNSLPDYEDQEVVYEK